jgi:hypothetical protein
MTSGHLRPKRRIMNPTLSVTDDKAPGEQSLPRGRRVPEKEVARMANRNVSAPRFFGSHVETHTDHIPVAVAEWRNS